MRTPFADVRPYNAPGKHPQSLQTILPTSEAQRDPFTCRSISERCASGPLFATSSASCFSFERKCWRERYIHYIECQPPLYTLYRVANALIDTMHAQRARCTSGTLGHRCCRWRRPLGRPRPLNKITTLTTRRATQNTLKHTIRPTQKSLKYIRSATIIDNYV